MAIVYVYVLLFSFLAFAPAAAGAGTTLGTPENQQQPQPLRHGTLLLSSVTLLDRQPPSHVPHRLLQNQAGSTDAQQHHRCCLTVKAYTTAVLSGSSTAQHAAQTPHSTVASAVFSTCSNSTNGNCPAALLQAAHGLNSGPYKVALLLSAPAEHNSAAAHEALSGHVQEEDTSTSDTTPAVDVSSSGSMLSAAEDVDAAGLEQTGSTVAAGGASKASILHDMLITIHAEQEVSGQVYLAFATQLVRAGTGVVRADIDMSHYTHTWTSARLLPSNKQDREPSTTAAASDNMPASPADSEVALTQAAGAAAASCGPAQEQVSAPTTGDLLAEVALSTSQPAQSTAFQAPAPQSASSPTGLLDLLPPQLAAEPSAVAAFLQAALGHGSGPAGQQAAAACERTSCTGSSSRQSSSCCCPALSGDRTAIQAWVADAQAALSSCCHEASLQEQLQSHDAVVPLAQPTTPRARQHSFVQAWISRARVAGGPAGSAACLLDNALAVVAASELPFISSATPDRLLLGFAAATAFLVLLMVKGCSSNRGKKQSPQRAAMTQPQQQQAVTASAAEQQQQATAANTAQDAWPLQEQDQVESLDDVLQGVDADPFGYGAVPAATTTAPAAAAAAPASGSLFAAAKAVKRASAMAAGEAAGALKDAFMRRNTSRSGAATVTAAALGSGSSAGWAAAGAGAGTTADWLDEEDEDKVNQLPDSAQRQLQAGGRWARDTEGRLVRSSWKAARNSLAAAAQTVLAAVGVRSGGATAAGPAAAETAAAGGTAAGTAVTGTAAAVGEWRDSQDAAALQQLLSAAPGSVVTFAAS